MPVKLSSTGGGSVTMDVGSTASNYTLTLPSSTGTLVTTASAGKILQVVQATLTSSIAGSSNAFTNIISAAITPSSTSSRIHICVNLSIGLGGNGNQQGLLLRNSTSIFIGDAASNRTRVTGIGFDAIQNASMAPMTINFVDSPSTTSSITYTYQMRSTPNSAYLYYVNRSPNDEDQGYRPRGATSLILMEIAG